MANFAQRLKSLREENNLLQKELAAKLNISRATLASWESGNRTPELGTAEKLADFFNVSIDYLLGRTDARQSNQQSHALSRDELDLLQKYRQLQEKQKDTIHKVADTFIPETDDQAVNSGK